MVDAKHEAKPAEAKAAEKVETHKTPAVDPWGDTPTQSRTEGDAPVGTAAALSGIDPLNDENTHIVGGTLPGV